MDDYISTKEAAEILGLTIQRISMLLKQGKLIGIKPFGRDWAVSRASVEARKREMESVRKK